MATLKISDLSVGDWVRTKDGNVTVDIISPLEVVVMNDYGNLCACKIEDIEPIPITAEVLEKNGFKCFYEDADTALYGTPLCSIFHTKGTLRYRLETPQASVVCWNIHDLQHALRLAGVEKEINL